MSTAELRLRLSRRARRVRAIGLTGSIGMGKSTAARMAKRMGIPVHDADKTAHALLAVGGAGVKQVKETFPGVENNAGGIDRKALGARVFGDRQALKKLESILHPLIQARKSAFLARMGRERRPVVVLDIPLLFETRGELGCDFVSAVTAPIFLRRLRVRARSKLTDDALAKIVALQTSEAFKRLNADQVIQTGLGHRFALRALRRTLGRVRRGPLRPYDRRRVKPHA